jgi:CubicO group peptidase (beta-lactamase class C family)
MRSVIPRVVAAVCLVAAATAWPTKGEAQDDRFARLEHAVADLFDGEQLVGLAAGVVDHGELVWARGFGHADVERDIPFTPQTLVRIASVSKPFAAILIMQLVDEGKLSLDTPMADFRVGKRYRENPILVRHVLSHTSEGTPGAAYKYSGNIFSDLTLVIEQATGESYLQIFAY